MGQINVSIGGRSYQVACRDGEEDHLAGLAAQLDKKATDLAGALGTMSEPRLLLMAGILIADELHELKNGGSVTVAAAAAARPDLSGLAARIEALAERLENERPSA
jgi:cell division protein ZapA